MSIINIQKVKIDRQNNKRYRGGGKEGEPPNRSYCFPIEKFIPPRALRGFEVHQDAVAPNSFKASRFVRILNATQEATIKGDVKLLSDKFRHGSFIDTSWDERKRALSLTWEIIRRYMFYLRGKGDLPELDFPLV